MPNSQHSKSPPIPHFAHISSQSDVSDIDNSACGDGLLPDDEREGFLLIIQKKTIERTNTLLVLELSKKSLDYAPACMHGIYNTGSDQLARQNARMHYMPFHPSHLC